MSLPVDPKLYLAFLGVMTVLAWTPGPANLFAVATGIQRGKKAALAGVVGMNTGTLVWFVAAALGLSALIAAYPEVFRWLAYAGAAYVAWLGLQSLRGALQAQAGAGPAHVMTRADRSALMDGFVVQVANPKALLFFVAVLPPFLDLDRPAAPQLAMFAAGTLGMDMISMSAYGLGGAALSSRMAEPRFRRRFSFCVALLLFTAAAMILLKA
jgi:threonine/homoserine/homoserine lactone efflux protein